MEVEPVPELVIPCEIRTQSNDAFVMVRSDLKG